MKDKQIQNALARVMLSGVLAAAAFMVAGLAWFLWARHGSSPGDRLFSGEPKYFENPVSMILRALDVDYVGHRRSVIMIGVVLLLNNPVIRVAFAAFGFAVQRDWMYTAFSTLVLVVLLLSFFW